MRFGLVADDLTGASDSSVPFLAAGPVTIFVWPRLPSAGVTCAAISTESRDEDPAESRRRSRVATQAIRAAGIDVLFRKVDSRARGNIAADIEGTLDGWGGGCVLAPALPDEGRYTSDGWQIWDGGRADLVSMLRASGLRTKVGLPDEVSQGEVVICNADSGADLQVIAGKIATGIADIVPAGTAALAARLAAAFNLQPKAGRRWPICSRPVAVIGSLAARQQATYAAAAGKDVLVVGPGQLPRELDEFDGLLLSGGETASRVIRWLDVEALELVGEVMPRVPVALCRGGRRDGMPVAMKSGGFGPVDAVASALDRLTQQ